MDRPEAVELPLYFEPSAEGVASLAPRVRIFRPMNRLEAIDFPPRRLSLIAAGGGYHVVSEGEIAVCVDFLVQNRSVPAALLYRTAPTRFPKPQQDFLEALAVLASNETPGLRASLKEGLDVFAMSAGAHLVLSALGMSNSMRAYYGIARAWPCLPIGTLVLFYPIVDLERGGGVYCKEALSLESDPDGYRQLTCIQSLVPTFIRPRKIVIFQDTDDEVADFQATLRLVEALHDRGFTISVYLTGGGSHGERYLRKCFQIFEAAAFA